MKLKSSLLKRWKRDENTPFHGWDFSYLKGRWTEAQPQWDYGTLAKKLVKSSTAVLDMATGGGERFSSFAPFPKHAVAIEGYKPNVAVAKQRLGPLGIKVIAADETKKLPFKDGEFDLVLNRHGGINKASTKEIFRILRPKGKFLTQQVEGSNLRDLLREFNTVPKWKSNTLANVKKYLVQAGFKIKDARAWAGKVTFKDIGALIYYLKAVPWSVKGFSIKTHLPILEKLQKKIEKSGKLMFTYRRFLILAEK